MLKDDREFNLRSRWGLFKSLWIPDSLNAVLWIRLFIWLEHHRLPTFLAYRWLLHVHGVEMCRCVTIGRALRMPHPHGVLFTEGLVIGDHAIIYGNVRFTKHYKLSPRIGNHVLIGDGAIFTGKSRIGDRVVVGAGAVVTREFPDDVVIAGNPARILHGKTAASVSTGFGQ